MKKHWGMQSIIIGITLIFGLTVFADQQPKQDVETTLQTVDTLLLAMQETGAQAEQIQLHYGTAYKTYENMEEVKTLAESMGQQLGLTQTTTRTTSQTPNQKPTEFYFQRHEQNVLTELKVAAIPSRGSSEKWTSYVTIKMSTDAKELKALQQQLVHVNKVLESSQIIPHFNTCIQGNVHATLKNDVQLERMNKLLDLLGAEVVEKVEDPTVKSFSAYSSELPNYIMTNGKRMNLQAGMHVDRLHGLTRITIGTPIITVEY